MITNISLVTVYCFHQDRARDFYVDVLGFSPGPTSPWGGVPVGHRLPPQPA